MNIKQWAVALLFGSLVLGAASCAKDDPNVPKSSVAIKDLEGFWHLGKLTLSPETITIEGKEYKIADHIFKTSFFADMSWTPDYLDIEGETAKLFPALLGGVPKMLTLTLKDGKLSAYNLPFGRVVRRGDQLNLDIVISKGFLNYLPPALQNQGEGAFVLKALSDQGVDLKITATGTK